MYDPNQIFKHQAVSVLREDEQAKYDQRYFNEDYWREDLVGQSGNRGLTYDDPTHHNRFAFLYDRIIAPYCPNSLLDVGCGPGFLLEQALSLGIDAQGIDSSGVARDLFSARASSAWCDRFVVGSIAKMSFADNSFDLCVCLDVLEHLIVFDIFSAVYEICRVSSRSIICSINLDNPYEFHPTILSRSSWIAVFESTGLVQYDHETSDTLNESVGARHPEYDCFVFHRILPEAG